MPLGAYQWSILQSSNASNEVFYYIILMNVEERTLPSIKVEVPVRCFRDKLTLHVNMYSHGTRDMTQSVPN